jgi:hypothetical protein
MRIRLRRAEKEGPQAAERAAEITTADPVQDVRGAPDPAPASWVHTQLRDRIQRAGAALALDTQTAHKQTCEADRIPLADREPEP